MKRPIFLIAFIFAIIVGLAIVRISVENTISTTGIELAKLQNEIDTYKKQNAVLKEQYLQLSSLTNVEQQAKRLGFIDAKSQVYLSNPLPLALNQ